MHRPRHSRSRAHSWSSSRAILGVVAGTGGFDAATGGGAGVGVGAGGGAGAAEMLKLAGACASIVVKGCRGSADCAPADRAADVC